MRVVRERVVPASLAAVGTALVAPTVVAPTWHQTLSDRERGALLNEQWEWSWGRTRVVGVGDVEVEDLWNVLGLGVLLVLLAAALAGTALWVVLRGSWVTPAGPLAVALLAGLAVGTSAARLGRTHREGVYGPSGLTLRTDVPGAAVMESVGALTLVAALVLMVVTLVRGSAGMPSGEAPGDAQAGRSGGAGVPAPMTGATRALAADASEPEAHARHLTTRPVGFADSTDEES